MATGKHGLLLLVLLLRHLLGPLITSQEHGEKISIVLFAVTLIVGVRSVLSEDKRLAKLFFGILGASIALALASYAFEGAVLLYLAMIGFAVFYVELIRVILTDILRPGRVGVDRIMGALAAYMLIATTWSVFYVILQGWLPHSFELSPIPNDQHLVVDHATGDEVWTWDSDVLPEERVMASVDDLEYFSFVTLTTLGYGEITPAGKLARRLATLEAMVGPIYLAVLLARLVSLHAAQTTSDGPDGDE